MINDVVPNLKTECEDSIVALGRDLSKIRTGRANVAILDGVRVDYYGSPTPLQQVANVTTPESRLLMVSPWDATQIGAIEKAILVADLGLTPSNDGKVIRIQIPELTEERRKELAKVAKKFGETAKISIRSHRKQANDTIKKLLKDKAISEDDSHKHNDEIQRITDEYTKKVDQAFSSKEKEILTI